MIWVFRWFACFVGTFKTNECLGTKTSELNLVLDDWEHEFDLIVGQSLVHAVEGFELSFDVLGILGVQENLQELRAILSHSSTLAHNLVGVADILHDAVLHCRQRARTRAKLTSLLALVLLTHDSALSDETHMLAIELLLKFTDQAALDLLEALVLAVGHENNDGLLSSHVHFFHGSDHQILEFGAQIFGCVL